MNRKDLHSISEKRIAEARLLLANLYFEGAYYLAGYSVECGLKACVAKQIRKHDFPDRQFVSDSYTHDLNKLIGLAGLRDEHRKKCTDDRDFELNWNVVKDWSEKDRYTVQVDEKKARDLIEAITNTTSGILS
jgi:hypothetical protein